MKPSSHFAALAAAFSTLQSAAAVVAAAEADEGWDTFSYYRKTFRSE